MRILGAILAVLALVAPVTIGEVYGGRACAWVVFGEVAIVLGVAGWLMAGLIPEKVKPDAPTPPTPAPDRHTHCLGCRKEFEEGDPKVTVGGGTDGSLDVGSCCLECTSKLRKWNAAKKTGEA